MNISAKNSEQQLKHLEQLVSRMVEGEAAAFGEIYKLYYNLLLRYGTIILSETKVVEDKIQDLFVWILENPQKIKKVKSFEIYLFQSLKRNLRQHIKKQGRSKAILQQFSKSGPSLTFQKSIEQQRIQEENQAFNKNWVKQKLDELPAHQKEIIFLRYYRGLSYDEIATIMSTNNQVVRNYVSRALRRIRKLGNLERFLSVFFSFLFL